MPRTKSTPHFSRFSLKVSRLKLVALVTKLKRLQGAKQRSAKAGEIVRARHLDDLELGLVFPSRNVERIVVVRTTSSKIGSDRRKKRYQPLRNELSAVRGNPITGRKS